MAKRYFAEQGIEFTDYDVSNDREALKRMASTTGQYGVPVISVGSRSMVGWDAGEFDRMLAG
jgi:glutaredoxin 3